MQITGAAGAAQANQIQQWRDRMFQRADADRSGGLSMAEFAQAAARRQERSPASPAATQAGMTQASGGTPANSAIPGAFRRLDSDGDGSLSRAELAAGAAALAAPSQGLRFSSATFTALLNTQGQIGSERAGFDRSQAAPNRQRPRENDQGNAPLDTALMRQLAAYRARQPATPGA